MWGSVFINNMGGRFRVSVVATGIEAETATGAAPGKVFTFPASRATATPAPQPAARAATPVPTPAPVAVAEPLELTDEADDELLLDTDDILTSPVAAAPIAPPVEEAVSEEKKDGGTLFERMSNIARGAAKAQVDEDATPGFRREPIDIPRFLNRQNNQ